MLHLIEYLDLGDMMNAFPSFCTIILMPFFYSIDHAIVAGLGACQWPGLSGRGLSGRHRRRPRCVSVAEWWCWLLIPVLHVLHVGMSHKMLAVVSAAASQAHTFFSSPSTLC
jgi:xanthine/uracil/vitamin C permease (AzgA family)